MGDAKSMTNSERGKKAAAERWNPNIPKATHTGVINIGGFEIICDVLDNGKRMIRQKDFLNAMGKGKIGGADAERAEMANLPVFLTADNLTPYLELEFWRGAISRVYKTKENRRVTGYEAEVLPKACRVYVQADDAGKVLKENQRKVASVCRAMIYGLAEVGIISLIDDATGFVYERERNELQKVLEAYIEKELLPWTKKFPDEFFEQVYRLHGWQWPKKYKNHPKCLGHFINDYIYNALPEVVRDELKRINPPNENGNRRHRHHQWLTESFGQKSLEKRVAKVITTMQLSDNLDQFKQFIEKFKIS